MSNTKKMTVAEVREYAMKNYNHGGDAIIECWTDSDIEDFLKTTKNPLRALKNMFAARNEEFETARYFSGYDAEKEHSDDTCESDENPFDDEDWEADWEEQRRYTSSTLGDYSPSNPWNAPGMSTRDFI